MGLAVFRAARAVPEDPRRQRAARPWAVREAPERRRVLAEAELSQRIPVRPTPSKNRGCFAGGGETPPDVFIGFEAGEATGFFAGDNLYCASSSDAHRFGWDATLVTFSEWLTASGTDETSSAVVDSDPLCAF
jgi:hypothetical protein